MIYFDIYHSPLGLMHLAASDQVLLGAWFEKQKYDLRGLPIGAISGSNAVINLAKVWLNAYFNHENPPMTIPTEPCGSDFAKLIYTALKKIPYGTTITYAELAACIAGEDQARRYARAVGAAVSKNPISIFIPCHRVLGANHTLTGYAGGIHRKQELLKIEGIKI